MAGRITKILLVLAILQYGLRADAQTVQTTAEVLTQHEEQRSQMTWLVRNIVNHSSDWAAGNNS